MSPKRSRTDKAAARRSRLRLAGGAAGLVLAFVFAAGLLGRAAAARGWGRLAGVPKPWLIALFDVNLGVESVLPGFNVLDVSVMALLLVTYLGLRTVVGRVGRIWVTAAMIVLIAGAVLFAVTGMAGRSSVMATGIVVSIVLLIDGSLGRGIGAAGILAHGLLLAADMATPLPSWTLVAVLMGGGYSLLIAWCFLVGGRMLLPAPREFPGDASRKSAVRQGSKTSRAKEG